MKVSLVVSVFNEEDAIPILYKTVRRFGGLKQHEVEIVFVNDRSKDATESIINALTIADPLVVPLSFARNFGKEPALFADPDHTTDDATIPIDIDLQDPTEVIPHMINKWQSGVDMVLAKRSDRSTDGRLKRKTAEWLYKLHNKINNPQIEENVGDFRLMSREAVENIGLLPKRNLFMRGVLGWIDGNTDVVEYARAERVAGSTKFSDWKLQNLALEGITSFSIFPLRMWTYIGLFVAGLIFLCRARMIINTLAFGNPVRGYPSLLMSILFLGGVQLIGIGVLGEYAGGIYIETEDRPRYIIKSRK